MTTPAPGWRKLPGPSRRYENTVTGETISRREYDRRFGRFAGSTLTPESLAEERRSRTTRGDTDYYAAPHQAPDMASLLAYLMRHGAGLVRFIYAPEGGPHQSTGWYRLSHANLPRIINEVMFASFRYSPESQLCLPGDLYLVAVAGVARRAA